MTITPDMIRDTASWSQSEDDLRETLKLAADALEAAIHGNVTAMTDPTGDALKACSTPAPVTDVEGLTLDALRRAEAFMSGFEGDEMQDGIDADLKALREAIEQIEVSYEAS